MIPSGLTLRELELLAGLRTAGLFPLDRSRIAGQQLQIAQLPAMRFVQRHQRAGDGETQRTSLTGEPAAFDLRFDIVAAERVRNGERLLNGRDVRRTREIISQRAPVNRPLARARLDLQPADGFLAPSDRMSAIGSHYFSLFLLRSSTFGCCAAWVCLSPAKTRSFPRSFWRPSAVFGSMP